MIAIYTPTYNRKQELKRLYESLCNQTNKNFFWLIIDDGSTDETHDIVKEWINENTIDIRYEKKENGGKHTALNLALKIVDSYWNICVDSDDYLISEDVIYKLNEDIEKYSTSKDIVSIVYPYQFKNQYVKKISRKEQLVKKYDLRSKKLNVREISILSRPYTYKDISFPIFKEENFISEGAIEIPKLLKGNRVYIHEPIIEGDYLQDGLSKNIIRIWAKNPKGYYYVRNLQIQLYLKRKMYLQVIKPAGQILAYNLFKKTNIFKGTNYHLIVLLSFPFGILYWLKKFR
ncbi:glycosyl transferase [Enterococcus innesii]|uniref:Glycosyl transferase n=1 Tax=Enterococcus innesii TaxID=2839759 RepID=A0ABN6NNH2_9ENTE|nr:glycosyltransferase family 2 protein [Enterococcus innesii]BDG67022.1 glycosyl transferase [Enterococcus innesii]